MSGGQGSDFAAVPDELKQLRQWVCWRLETQGRQKATKPPYCARTGESAKVNDPGTWSTFEEAVQAAQSQKFGGIGFMFTAEDLFCGVDLDNALVDGSLKDWASRILDRLPPNAYVEVSPSGNGIHAIVKAKKSGRPTRAKVDDGAIEIYDDKRYFTVTGNAWEGKGASAIPDGQGAIDALCCEYLSGQPQVQGQSAPASGTLSDDQILIQAFASKNGDRIRALWGGDSSAYGSKSEADLALCSHLWHWTGGDAARVDSLFRQSGLMRGKWERADYLESTISRAAANNFLPRSSGHRSDRAQQTGSSQASKAPNSQARPRAESASHDRPGPETELGNALRIADNFKHKLRYAEGLGFLAFTGKRWEVSDVLARQIAGSLGTIIAREVAQLQSDASAVDDVGGAERLGKQITARLKWARQSEQMRTIENSLKLAQGHLLLKVDELDALPFDLNVINGTLDLRKRELRKHNPGDFLTKLAPVAFDPEARCPKFSHFIEEITSGNEEVAKFLQKSLGYSITGDVSEQCLFVCHGDGLNGKSTLFEVIRKVLGKDFVAKAPPNLLMEDKFGRDGSVENAALRGLRLAICQEAPNGKIFDSSKVKELTGEQVIKGRQMYRGYFELAVHFKIWITANEVPMYTDDSFGFKRRIHVIPFKYQVPAGEVKKGLDEVLVREASGILNWLVDGVQLFLKEGLKPPKDLELAAEAYHEDCDSLGRFLKERCELGPDLRVKSSLLLSCFRQYNFDQGLSARATSSSLKAAMQRRNFPLVHDREANFYRGLTLRFEDSECTTGGEG